MPGTKERKPITTWLWLNPRVFAVQPSEARLLYRATGGICDVWGPLNGGAYSVEFARMDAGTMRIYIDGNLIWEFPDVTAQPPGAPMLQQVGHRWMFPSYAYILVGPEKIVAGPEKIVNDRVVAFYKELFKWAKSLLGK